MPALQEGVEAFLVGDSGRRAVARGDDGLVGEREDFLADAVDELCHVAAPQVGTSHAAVEDGVAADEQCALKQVEGQAARTVAGDVQHLNGLISQLNGVAVSKIAVDGQ